MIHCVEFRALLGQPDQGDVEVGGPLQTLVSGMSRPFVEQHPHGALTIAAADLLQKRPKVFLARVFPAEENAMPGAWIEGSKEHPPIIATGDGNLGLLALKRPAGSQRRQKAQSGFIFD